MMHLTETNILQLVKRQLDYKFKSHVNIFTTLVLLQIIALLLSVFGLVRGHISSVSQSYSINISLVHSSVSVFFTLIWCFVSSLRLTAKRDADFAFVSNRLSSNLSNIGILTTLCIAAGVSSGLGSLLLRNIIYFKDAGDIIGTGFFIPPGEVLIGIASITLYAILLSALGYLTGALSEVNKILKIILPAVYAGLIISQLTGTDGLVSKTFIFFIQEPSLAVFATKILSTALLLFTAGATISNYSEVRR